MYKYFRYTHICRVLIYDFLQRWRVAQLKVALSKIRRAGAC